jgi:hypothetical protein
MFAKKIVTSLMEEFSSEMSLQSPTFAGLSILGTKVM